MFISLKKFFSTKNISLFPTPKTLENLNAELQEKILTIQKKIGFIPNIFLTLAYRPQECKAFCDYHDLLMDEKTSELTKSEREMIVVATSSLNHCRYCVISHGAILRVYEKNTRISDDLSINYKKADLTEKQRIMLDFAIKVSRNSENIDENDISLLKKYFSEAAIWDIGSITSFFAMSNRLANFMNIKPNEEFYNIGRLKKEKNI